MGRNEGSRREKIVRCLRKYGVCAGILGLAILVISMRGPEKNRIDFLSVGQGDCTLVRTVSGQVYLFDCGSSSRGKVGKYVLLPFLKYNGIQRIDGIILSHPDTDHVNGALELLEIAEENRISIEQLILPDIRAEEKEGQLGELMQAARSSGQGRTEVRFLAEGDSWRCGDASFLCLHPTVGDSGENANSYSVCVYVSFGSEGKAQMTALFTGDVEGYGEKELIDALSYYGIETVDLLKVAHHGSGNATSTAFLQQIDPLVAVISCGENNRYGHPHEETLERLRSAGTVIYQTPKSGAITVYPLKSGLRVECYHTEQ